MNGNKFNCFFPSILPSESKLCKNKFQVSGEMRKNKPIDPSEITKIKGRIRKVFMMSEQAFIQVNKEGKL